MDGGDDDAMMKVVSGVEWEGIGWRWTREPPLEDKEGEEESRLVRPPLATVEGRPSPESSPVVRRGGEIEAGEKGRGELREV
jgi:hypothetical protein